MALQTAVSSSLNKSVFCGQLGQLQKEMAGILGDRLVCEAERKIFDHNRCNEQKIHIVEMPPARQTCVRGRQEVHQKLCQEEN